MNDETATMKPKWQIVIAFGIGAALIAVLAGIKIVQIRNAMAAHSYAPPPEVVTTVVVAPTTWKRTLHAVGSLVSVRGVVLSAELPGRVTAIHVENGTRVEKDTVLIELDTSVEEADLRAAEARLWRARHAFERSQMLKSSKATSQANFEEADAAFREASAQVQSLKAAIARKRIIAPFAGQLGIRQVSLGQYVLPGTEMVPLYSLDPLYVNFSLPQDAVMDVAVGQDVEITTETLPGKVLHGTIHAINPNLDVATRTLSVQALLANPDEVVKPGMFVSISLVLDQSEAVLPVPLTAINHAPYGDSLYIVGEMKNEEGASYRGVRQQIVKLGARRGDLVAVTEGLHEGDEVVTSGVFKLRPGAAVTVDNALAPPAALAPHVADS